MSRANGYQLPYQQRTTSYPSGSMIRPIPMNRITGAQNNTNHYQQQATINLPTRGQTDVNRATNFPRFDPTIHDTYSIPNERHEEETCSECSRVIPPSERYNNNTQSIVPVNRPSPHADRNGSESRSNYYTVNKDDFSNNRRNDSNTYSEEQYNKLRSKYKNLKKEHKRLRDTIEDETAEDESKDIDQQKCKARYEDYKNFLEVKSRRPFICSRDKEEHKLAKFIVSRTKAKKTKVDNKHLPIIEELLTKIDFDYPKEFADWMYHHPYKGTEPNIRSSNKLEKKLAKWLREKRNDANMSRISKEECDEITKFLGKDWFK